MVKQSLVYLLALVLLNSLWLVSANTQSDQTRAAKRAKARISKLNTQGNMPVEVRLRDGTTVVGYLTEVAADHFVVSDLKTSTATSIAYADLKRVEKVERLSLTRKAYMVFAFAGLGLGLAAVAAALIHPR